MTATPPTETDAVELTLSLLDALPDDCPPTALDDALALLSNHRRRRTLMTVLDHGEPLTLPDVADEVAIDEHDRPLTEISPETVTNVYISIYHDHLPRLVDAGLVTYDQERDLVSPAFEL
ncbi:DUF7344 domain-containing protein [Halovivax gelatinilyticus]|uniref:DUF7344 domain-containing protein n=1 Tax=Halovivax gelatinilyticus TaxID=2961597 RepID=UPI0020CA7056|nr:hypothetical protein [Halovivax gelatinilyticus]